MQLLCSLFGRALPIELSRRILFTLYSIKLGKHKVMVARDGIEPPTQGFSVLCSTD
jgi:hypothetical protein